MLMQQHAIIHSFHPKIPYLVHAYLRSFTAKDPSGSGSNIGIVLYQRAFYIGKANEEKVQELLGRDPYPNGGAQISWEMDIASA